jgi:hypothetical protein
VDGVGWSNRRCCWCIHHLAQLHTCTTAESDSRMCSPQRERHAGVLPQRSETVLAAGMASVSLPRRLMGPDVALAGVAVGSRCLFRLFVSRSAWMSPPMSR